MNSFEYYSLVDKFYKEKEKFEEWERSKKKEFYKIINSAFKDENKLSFIYERNGYNVTKVVNTKTEYDIPKLKDRLDKTSISKVLERNIVVKDSKALLSLFKKYGVKKDELKSIVDINYRINEKELEQQLQLGNIKRSDINSVIKVTQNEPYFKVEKIKENS